MNENQQNNLTELSQVEKIEERITKRKSKIDSLTNNLSKERSLLKKDEEKLEVLKLKDIMNVIKEKGLSYDEAVNVLEKTESKVNENLPSENEGGINENDE